MGAFFYILSLVFISAAVNINAQENSQNSNDQWLVSVQDYQGYPLALRIRTNIDKVKLTKYFSQLICITLKLEKVKENGLPEDDYNLSITDFDLYLCSFFEKSEEGIVVLVETYHGERNYYFYTKKNIDAQKILKKRKNKYQNYSLSSSGKEDSKWEFIDKYQKQFKW